MTAAELLPPMTRTAVEDYLAHLDDDDFYAVIADARSRAPHPRPDTRPAEH
ncbi:hypothetical protein HQ308_16865 [Rhodococcus sp. BP-241]|uniref:hypothetical protein n=1 Tax=Rhodococcus sp. BP-241 TaxID=2739441 RepID=UPI001C9A990B|nr:hypothetical protein [Rhodococcus sp. BP-241]MBY6708474.1 hypothetical protein [Rhodococcus sp. BP-241]